MTFERFLEHMRQEIREEGFMSAVQLASRMANRMVDLEIVGEFDLERAMSQMECDDIYRVEYTNWLTKDYRVKDLFYFMPRQ